VVTAADAGGSASAASATTALVRPPAPGNTSAPQVSGTPSPGSSLTTTLGTWTGSPSSLAIDWQRCDAAGATCTSTGVTGTTYLVVAGDLGSRLRAVVTASNAGGSTPAVSSPTAVVMPAPPQNDLAPIVTGDAKVGSTLGTSNGGWNGANGFTYRWWRCVGSSCAYVDGATAATITLSAGDVGATFRSVVTATNAGGSVSAHSAPTAAVAGPVSSQLLLMAGTAAVSRRPVGGGIFTARIAVVRTDGKAVAGATVTCGARVAGRALHVRSQSFAGRIATCVWNLPRWTSGRSISGSIRVAAGGLVASQTFSSRIG
jgi:hypothetical protein